MYFGTSDDRPTRYSPHGETVGEAARFITSCPEVFDGVNCKNAIRPATVCYDWPILWNFPKAAVELVERNRKGSGDVFCLVFERRSHIDQSHIAVFQPTSQLGPFDWLQLVTPVQVNLGELVNLMASTPRNLLNAGEQGNDGIVSDPVEDKLCFLPSLDEACGLQHPQVRARVVDGKGSLSRQSFYCALTLGEDVEELDAPGAGERVSRFGPRLV
jgi:hypothetical protein